MPWALVAIDATGGQGGLVGKSRPLAAIITNIWLFAGLFCLLGGGVIWLQARWDRQEIHQPFADKPRSKLSIRQVAKSA